MENVHTKQLNIGSIKVPINGATKTWAILAKRGAGKTYTAAVMAEEFYKCGIPFVVFDPIDVWWGLRLAANGKDKGLPIVVFGLEHADIKIDRDMGRKIAQAIVKDNISCVISTFGMPKVAQRHLIAEFSEEILNITNTPRHIFIEEAHEFVPQRVTGAMGKTFSAVEALVVMGRNRGLGVTLINQRAATVNKDVLTQLDTLLAFQNTSPQDRKALREWVEFHAAEGDFEKFMASLPHLPKGEGWIWSPEFMGVFEKLKIRQRETFHPDREKIGDKFVMPELNQIDIQTFIEKFSKLPTLKKTDKEKEAKLIPPEKVIIPDFSEQERRIRNEYESQLMQRDLKISELNKLLDTIRSVVGVEDTATNSETILPHESNLILQKMGGMPRNIYETLLNHPNGLTKRQIALMCGYSVTSGSYSNALSKLRTMGLVNRNGEEYRALLK
jgi:hypothetical protein